MMKGGANIAVRKIRLFVLLAVLSIFFIVASFPLFAYAEERAGKKEGKQEATPQKKKNPYAHAQITTKILSSANKTFGYEILVNGKTLVCQPSIPALPGNDGFKTRKQAQKVADFVVKKIKKNELPPTVTINDLKRMGVLKKG